MIEQIDYKKIQMKTLMHYSRMQAFVKTQPKTDKPNLEKMEQTIGEDWYDESCPYCQSFRVQVNNTLYFFECLEECPLHKEEETCCSGLWVGMSKSRTWAEWLKRSKKVVKFIEKYGVPKE